MLGDKNFPEEYILGDLYQQALEAQGYTVTLKPNIGSTEITFDRAQVGEDPGLSRVRRNAAVGRRRDLEEPCERLRRGERDKNWASKHGYMFTNTTPFTDSDAIAVLKSYANANGLKAIGDLKKLGKRSMIGGAPEFQTRFPDGLVGLQREYHVNPTFKPVNIACFYPLLDNKTVNAAVVFTTDPQLKSGKYVVLKDTKFIFGFQNVGLVVKQSVATAEGPAFTATINKVSALLTQNAIIALNAAVELDKQSPATVAKAFLKDNHLWVCGSPRRPVWREVGRGPSGLLGRGSRGLLDLHHPLTPRQAPQS